MDAPIALEVEVPEFENDSFGQEDEPLKESGLSEERSDQSPRTSSTRMNLHRMMTYTTPMAKTRANGRQLRNHRKENCHSISNAAGGHDSLVAFISTSRKCVCSKWSVCLTIFFIRK